MDTTTTRRGGAALLWLALILTTTAPVALNAVSLTRLATDRLGLHGVAALALPMTIDGAALVALVIRLRALREGDGAPGASVAVVAFAGLSAWLAAVEGHAVGGTVGAAALGALPIIAVVMLDLAVASVRRQDLRAAGMLPGRAPVFSPLRWTLAPRSTFAAWRHGVLWEDPDRQACLAATAPGAAPRVQQLPDEAPDPAPVSPHEVLSRPTPIRAVTAAVADGLPPAPWPTGDEGKSLARAWVEALGRVPTRGELAARSGWPRDGLATSVVRTLQRESAA